MANSVDSDQTAPIGAVCSGSTLFASILNYSVMLGNYLQKTTSADNIFRCIFSWGFKCLLEWKTMWILIRWLRQKPSDLDLLCFQKNVMLGISYMEALFEIILQKWKYMQV